MYVSYVHSTTITLFCGSHNEIDFLQFIHEALHTLDRLGAMILCGQRL